MNDTPTDSQEEDVNDVLSSIRDLVSQEAKSHAELEQRKKEEAEAQERSEIEAEAAAKRLEQERAELELALMNTPEPVAAPLVLGEAELVSEDEDDAVVPLTLGASELASEPEQSTASTISPVMLTPAMEATPAEVKPEETGSGTTPYFDEGELRNIVGEMVREELQGELGDRINRNIRKLVRREVLRFMDAEDEDNGGKLTL